jgi:hypothetical protein
MLDAWFSAVPTADAKYAAMIRQIQTGDSSVSKA